MDDLTLTTTTHIQARWVLPALEDSISWARMEIQISHTEEGARGHASQDADSRRGDPINSRKSD